jgi:uncharacterized protein
VKLLIVLLAVLAGVWLWRRGRQRTGPPVRGRPGPGQALPMVRCAHCGVHLPGQDAVRGSQGSYCTVAHRREAEGA